MWEQQLAFWVIALAMAGAAIGVVRTNNVVHAALFLVVVLAGSAAQYILLVAEFVAWVQVLIYIGAVIVLFLFGIMLTRAPMRGDRDLNNVVHAALFLVVVLAGSAAQYILLVAEFVAWVQVLIYIGAVIVLFLFGIMLTRAPMRGDRDLNNEQRWAGAVVALFVLGVLTALFIDAFGGKDIKFTDKLVHQGSAANVGTELFRTYVVPFEVVSMLLLAALVGAIVLARRD